MITRIRLWWELRRLVRERAKLDNKYRSQYEKFKAEKAGRAILQDVDTDWMVDRMEYDTEIAFVRHRLIKNRAEALFLPVPSFNEKSGEWTQDQTEGRWRLDDKELARLLADINKYESEASDVFLKIAGSITGILGLVVAILALATRK